MTLWSSCAPKHVLWQPVFRSVSEYEASAGECRPNPGRNPALALVSFSGFFPPPKKPLNYVEPGDRRSLTGGFSIKH